MLHLEAVELPFLMMKISDQFAGEEKEDK